MQTIEKLNKKKSLVIKAAALVLTASCVVTTLSQTVFAKNTYVITDGDQVMVHTTYETNPAEVLDEAGLDLKDEDIYETLPGEDEGVSEITVRRGMNVVIDYCGDQMEVVAYGETVQELFDRLGISVREESEVSVQMDEVTYEGMEIAISLTMSYTDSYTVTIPYETVYQKSDNLEEGTEVVLTEGVDGEKTYSDEVTCFNGKEIDRVAVSEEIITEPVDKVVLVGTGKNTGKNSMPVIGDGVIITSSGEVLTYSRRETFKATSYCRTCEGGEFTATGTPTRVGAIAVDPSVIPYGTRMFIVTQDGQYVYGIATAEDCGGAIKGKRLDLFYETLSEALAFGVRYCDVYFLD